MDSSDRVRHVAAGLGSPSVTQKHRATQNTHPRTNIKASNKHTTIHHASTAQRQLSQASFEDVSSDFANYDDASHCCCCYLVSNVC